MNEIKCPKHETGGGPCYCGYIMFHGKAVRPEYKTAYMNGYDNPYGVNKELQFPDAYELGQIAARQDNSMEGTF